MSNQGKCKYTAKDGWQCSEMIYEAEGLCVFHTGKIPDADLQLKRFEERLADTSEEIIRLDGFRFVGNIVFKGRIFNRSISFADAIFPGNTTFEGAEFRGDKTIFDRASFRDSAYFPNVKFLAKETSFSGTKFSGSTTPHLRCITAFDKSTFDGIIMSFSKAEFGCQETSFKEVQFLSKEETNFESALFKTEANFEGTEPGKVFYSNRVNFKNLKIADGQFKKESPDLGWKGSIRFKWANLSQTEFLNTDMSKMDFMNVEWDHQYDSRSTSFIRSGLWRSRLHDETIWRDKRRKQSKAEADDEYLTWLDKSYRTLKDYYRQEGENHLVGHFNYGVMEIRLYNDDNKEVHKGISWLKRKLKHDFSWLHIYKITSGYGEDYGIAGRLLALIIVVFGLFFWAMHVPSQPCDEVWAWWERGFHSLLYSFQAGTLSKIEFYKVEELSLLGRFLHLTESILVPTQFAFFVIALRNRYRR